jgi:ribonuclease E
VATVAEIPAAETPAAIYPPAFADAPVPMPAVTESAASVPESAPAESRMSSISAAVNAATNVMSAVVRDFERVIAPQSEPPAPAAVEPEAAPVQYEPPSIEAKIEELPAVVASVPEPESAPAEPAKQDESAPAALQPNEYHHQEAIAEQKVEDAVERIEAAQPEEQAPTAAVTPATVEESSATNLEEPVQAAVIANEITSDRASVEADSAESTTAARSESHARAGKKESDIAETTAAAWASWRRIRESGDAKGNAAQSTESKMESQEEASAPKDTAAMAVAAGAEKAPEEGPAAEEDSGDIANIVDSVLADMRPKIVEEISRKMKKKK